MNALDVAILILVIGVAIRGVAAGFLRQAGSLGGFVLGLIIGASIAPLIASALSSSAGGRAFIALVVFFGLAITLGGLGEAAGSTLSVMAEKHRLRALDSSLGAALGIVVALFTVWLLAATFARSTGPALAAEIQSSQFIQSLDRALPPAPDVLAKLERTLGGGVFPQVFAGLEPTPAPPVTGPDAAAINAAAAKGRAATVKIEGLGCGGLLEGSGFVVGPGLVATNAHVVAGVAAPQVVDANGRHSATLVMFDPDLDFAVLKTSHLAASPLPLSPTSAARGTVGAVLGYPGGGDFSVSPAAVLDEQVAVGRNIYDSGLISRDIYEIQSIVRPGNSGGPLITPDGKVIGIVFAMSTSNSQVGYALTSPELSQDLRTASTSGPVDSGLCVSD